MLCPIVLKLGHTLFLRFRAGKLKSLEYSAVSLSLRSFPEEFDSAGELQFRKIVSCSVKAKLIICIVSNPDNVFCYSSVTLQTVLCYREFMVMKDFVGRIL